MAPKFGAPKLSAGCVAGAAPKEGRLGVVPVVDDAPKFGILLAPLAVPGLTDAVEGAPTLDLAVASWPTLVPKEGIPVPAVAEEG